MTKEQAPAKDSMTILFNGSRLDAIMDVGKYFSKCIEDINSNKSTFMVVDPNADKIIAYYYNSNQKLKRSQKEGELHCLENGECQVYIDEQLVANGNHNLSLEEAINLITGLSNEIKSES